MVNIAVIGGGVIGVTSALQIQKDIKNSKVTVFAEQVSPNTTGDVSAGFWMPYLLGNTPKKDITRWSQITYNKLFKLWKEGQAEEAGICLLPVIILLRDEMPYEPDWLSVPFAFSKYSSDQVQKLSKQHGINYKSALHFITFTCEPAKLLPKLTEEFLSNGGALIRKKIKDLTEVSHYDVIINCTGLGARNLVQDKDLHAIRGQVSRVKAPWQNQIVIDEDEDGCYIIPNTHYIILGGTHQVGDENLKVDPKDKENILNRCSKIVPSLKTYTEHLDSVGLRPGRSAVRIESENLKFGNRNVVVINNYGHGGAGVTLCFGCAEYTSKLLQKALTSTFFTAHL